MSEKADVKEMQQALAQHEANITKNMNGIRQDLETSQQQFQDEIAKNSMHPGSLEDIYQLIEMKADANQTQTQIQEKIDLFKSNFKNEEISNIYQLLESKLDLKQQQDSMITIYK